MFWQGARRGGRGCATGAVFLLQKAELAFRRAHALPHLGDMTELDRRITICYNSCMCNYCMCIQLMR